MVEKIEPYKGIAASYDEIRPSYPEKLIEDVISKTGINLRSSLLEIGAGTGKATVQFAEKGFTIKAVELGEDMAELLRAKCISYPKVSIDVSAFEDWKCPDNKKYDLIYCAQAFHWLDGNIKYKKCHELLKENAYLALFWYNPCDDLPLTREIDGKIERIIEKYSSNYRVDNAKPQRRAHDGISDEDARKVEIEKSEFFNFIEKIEYKGESRSTAKQYLKVKKSVPAIASIFDNLSGEAIDKMENEIIDVINDHGGYVNTLFKFSLYIAKKVS